MFFLYWAGFNSFVMNQGQNHYDLNFQCRIVCTTFANSSRQAITHFCSSTKLREHQLASYAHTRLTCLFFKSRSESLSVCQPFFPLKETCEVKWCGRYIHSSSFDLIRIWTYHTKNTSGSGCHHHYLHHWHSYNNAGFENIGRGLGGLLQDSCRQNRNWYL